MHREHDERAKLIAEQALDRLGEVQRELEIPATDALRFDLSLKRRLLADPLPTYLTLLALLFDCDCMIEVFSSAVSLADFWDSQLKQLAWRRQQQQKMKAGPGPTPIVSPSRLWIISAGRPEGLLGEYQVQQRAGFPSGVYEVSQGHVGHGMNIGLVVVSELPLCRETLLLRLMGSVAVCRQALREMGSVPDADPDAGMLRRLRGFLRHTLSRATKDSDEEKEDMTASWAEFERYEQSLVDKGLEKGLEKGLREAITDLCEAWGVPVSAGHREQLEGMDLDGLRALKEQLKRTRTWSAV